MRAAGAEGGARGLGDPAARIELTDEPEEADVAAIGAGIRAFNDEAWPAFRRQRVVGRRPLAVFVRDDMGDLLGGFVGNTHWGWLVVDDLWLAQGARGRGLGTRVLAAAEAEAVARGCTRARLWTYGFQARGFYEKQGWRVVGELADYPPGSAMYWMRKELAPDGAHG